MFTPRASSAASSRLGRAMPGSGSSAKVPARRPGGAPRTPARAAAHLNAVSRPRNARRRGRRIPPSRKHLNPRRPRARPLPGLPSTVHELAESTHILTCGYLPM